MNMNTIPYHVVELTPGRRIWLNTLELSWTAHVIYGLLEVDVTLARKYIAEHKARTGESLSFTAFLAFCLGRAVEEHKEVQACIKGRRQLVINGTGHAIYEGHFPGRVDAYIRVHGRGSHVGRC